MNSGRWMGVVTSLKIISSPWHLGSIWECSACKMLGAKMNKNSISHGVPKEHVWPLIWLWILSLCTTLHILICARQGCATSMFIRQWSKMRRKAFISLKLTWLPVSFSQSAGLPLQGEGGMSPEAEHPWFARLASTPEVAVSPHGVSGAQWAWDSCWSLC